MTDIELIAKDPAKTSADAIVVAVAPGTKAGSKKDSAPRILSSALGSKALSRLTDLLPVLGVTGKADEVVRVPAPDGVAASVVVLTGVGPLEGTSDTPAPEALRRAAGAATRALAGTDTAVLALPAGDTVGLAAVAEGALMGAYRFDAYRSSDPAPVARLQLASPVAKTKDAKAALARAVVVADAVRGTRDLVNASPKHLFPGSFADAARSAAKGSKVSVTVLDEKQLAAGGYGGILGVGQGSSRPPRLVKVVHSPTRPRAHYALVGKGITFDSGGLSLKPAKSMENMKDDMAGAATVLHAVLAAAALNLPVKVTGWLALAENMPGGGAQRPSDVVTMRGGTTVEVLNTDAEGRLVMADALVAAVEEKPDAVLDVATLTGAQVVALGSRVAGVMGDDEVRSAVVSAGDEAGEQLWPMPLPPELRASLDSAVADIANVGGREGGMLTAGLFLKEFVGEVPWAHLDVAGPAFNESGPYGYTPKGGTGMGVRTLLGLLEAAGSR
ncbi:leucyl aminopeptidase [Georgenia alba]|uniref:Probable cytosol aminopeptidase n=1 Tax=Georgenia alba TaxID=2233858 RepID=A0ABW2QBD5_9MICO